MRDPQFTRALDSWLGGRAVSPPPAFSPFELRGVRFDNRFGLAESAVAVTAEGRTTADEPTIAEWQRPEGQVLLRLAHAGRRGATRPRAEGVDLPLADGWPLVSASAIPYGPFGATPGGAPSEGWSRCALPSSRRPLARPSSASTCSSSTWRTATCSQAISRRSRTGARTSSEPTRFDSRCRVLDAVRAEWKGPLSVRLSVTDWHPRGNRTSSDGIAIARVLREHGCDLIHVEAGQTIHDDRPQYRRGFLTALSDRVRNEARVPTLVGGYLTTLDEANTIVGAGRADLVLLDLPEPRIESPVQLSNTVLLGEVRA